jgi:hypothetical protein
MFPSFYHSILEKYLTPAQLLTIQMLVWLLQSQKQVRIERLAASLPLPILQSSRRRHIQRFLQIKARAHTCTLVPDRKTGDIPSNRSRESISRCIG